MKDCKLIVIGLFIFSFIFIYFDGGKVPYMIFYISILMPLVSLIYTLLVYVRFKYSHEIDKNCVLKGEKVTLNVKVHNESIMFFPYIKLNFLNSDKLFNNQLFEETFSLTPKSNKSASYNLDCKYRGSYSVGIDNIILEDFTGTFKLRYKPSNFFNITVKPKIIYLDRFFLKSNFISESHSNLNTNYKDFSTISHLKEYSQGDNKRYIHWKASAKFDHLMVKNFQSTSGVYVTLVFDTLKNSFADDENIIIEDKLIESLIAILYYLFSNLINVRIIFYKDKLNDMELKNLQDFEKIYDYMSTLEFDSTIDTSNLLKIYLGQTINSNNLLLITCNINYNIYEQIINAKMSGLEPSLIYVSPAGLIKEKIVDEEIILSSLNEQNINTYKIGINDDIKKILERYY